MDDGLKFDTKLKERIRVESVVGLAGFQNQQEQDADNTRVLSC
jgi:hypothetical protein